MNDDLRGYIFQLEAIKGAAKAVADTESQHALNHLRELLKAEDPDPVKRHRWLYTDDNAGYSHLNRDEQVLIAQTINGLFPEGPYTGGCRTYYSPEEWRGRNEQYGTDSVLIVCHDGGDFASMFNHAYENFDLMEQGRQALAAIGYFAEQCTSWYTAVYAIDPIKE